MRNLILAVTTTLGFLAASSTLATSFFTASVREAANEISKSVFGIKSAGALESQIRAFARQGFLFESGLDAKYKQRQIESEAAIQRSLLRLKSASNTMKERLLYADIDEKTRIFLIDQSFPRITHNPLANFNSVSTQTREIEDDIQNFIDLKVNFLDRLQSLSEKRDRQVTLYSTITVIASIGFCLALILWVHNFFYRPVLALNDALRGYGHGDRSLRMKPNRFSPKEIVDLKEQFNGMVNSLEGQRERQLNFLASVAHDLRNPLGGIQMAAQLMSDDSLSLDQRDFLRSIDRQARHMNRLVSDLLDITRIEAGKFDLILQPEDLSQLAEQSILLYQATTQSHQIIFSKPVRSVVVSCDGARIGQVINNVISNAIKYSPGGGAINVSVRKEIDQSVISISDQGTGIPTDELKNIFEPFRRSKQNHSAVAGEGLGLSAAKRIIESHDGHIEVLSRLGEGSEFQIILPS